MFRNYIIIAIRNILRNKLFSVINILGLALGMAATLLITEYIIHEFSYNKFHDDQEEIYRAIVQEEKDGNIEYSEIFTSGLGESLLTEFPEVGSMVRLSSPGSGYFSYNDINFYENNISYADSGFFEVLSFNLLSGDPKTALSEPRSVVLTESVVNKIFGDFNPLGEVIELNGEENMKVTGVVADPPSNSSIAFDAIISFSTLNNKKNVYLGWDGGWSYTTYVRMAKGTSPETIQGQFEEFMEKHINYKYRQHGFVLSLILQPLDEVHLYSGRDYGLDGEGRLTNLYVFLSIALFILIIACFNFMNLSTARSVKRAKEVGIRKVVGAEKKSIVWQFIGESIFISSISLFLALIMVELFQPFFNSMSGRELQLFQQSGWLTIFIFIIIIVFTGVLAGSYPAFFMSRFQAIRIIKGNFVQQKARPVFRNMLVFIQFFISAFLIFGTIVIQSQINFLQNKHLGFESENVAIFHLETELARNSFESLKNRVNSVSGVTSCGASTGIPGHGLTMNGYFPEGKKDPIMIHVLDVDDDYLDLMEIPLVQGEGFSIDAGLDSANILINETTARLLGWDHPVGKKFMRNERYLTVIGVVQDFHFAPLSENIMPLMITQSPYNGFYSVSVKIKEVNLKSSMTLIEGEWNNLFPEQSFEYYMLEDYIDDAYREISGLRKIFIYFSILAILVACMGLLGLAFYSISQRSKEVGIRKVFGASAENIIRKFTGEFLRWVLLANILALPVAWFLMNNWLNNFAYHAGLNVASILYTLLITLGLSFMTVIIQTFHLAGSNPADVLKNE